MRAGRQVDFGTILDKWEKKAAGNKICPKEDEEPKPGNSHSRARNIKTDAVLDLHGFGSDEAWIALEAFFENSRKREHRKVLIIHGKGNHRSNSRDETGGMRDLTRRFIESCSFAGKSGYSPGREGGTGATWVMLKDGD